MPLTPEQKALIVKIGKYYLKHKLMIDEFAKAKDVAVSAYRAAGFTDARVKLYEAAWETMPESYKSKIEAIDKRIKNWIRKYAFKMFGVTLRDEEVDSLYAEITRGVTPISP